MYRGMHFMSDVVAGMILGAVSVAVTLLILTPPERERRAHTTPPAQSAAHTTREPVPGGIS
jgi:membrane-associated phospholipid phosphatase